MLRGGGGAGGPLCVCDSVSSSPGCELARIMHMEAEWGHTAERNENESPGNGRESHVSPSSALGCLREK